jgi:hypothetical protein
VDHALSGCPVFEDLESALRHCVTVARRNPDDDPVPSTQWPASGWHASSMLPSGLSLRAEVESEMGWFVGPIAPEFVRRAAARSKDVRDMLRHLAGSLPAPVPHNAEGPRDSLQFRLEHLGPPAAAEGAPLPGSGMALQGAPMPAAIQEVVDRVGRELASDLAPVLGVLASRVPAAPAAGALPALPEIPSFDDAPRADAWPPTQPMPELERSR